MNGVQRGIFALVVLAGCTDGLALSVDVKTDFVPGPEFAAVRVTLVGEDEGTTVGAAGDYLSGERAIDLSGLEENRARVVSVELIDRLGGVVAERSALVDHRVDRGLTLTLARDCAGVSCPGAGAAAATACFGGRCTAPECIDGTEPSCPEPECNVDTDCPLLNACSSRRCIDTLCLYAPAVGACNTGFYCSPENGCLALPSPVDASNDARPMADAGIDVGADANTGPPSVPQLTWPQNGVATGPAPSVTFRWAPVVGAALYFFEIRSACPVEMATPCDAPMVFNTSASQEELEVALGPIAVGAMPMGRRFRWRVRACRDDVCSDWSPERYLDSRRGPSDFDGDGTDELLVGSLEHATFFEWSGADFAVVGEIFSPFADATSGFAQTSHIGDVNADGYMDAVIGARYDRGFGSVAIYHGGPGGLTLDQTIQNPPSSPINNSFSRYLCIADFDADGYADLAVGATNGTFVYRGTSAGISPTVVAELSRSLTSCADVNEDGRADVVAGASYYPGDAASLVDPTPVTTTYASYFVGDANGDGFADFTGGSTGVAEFVYGNAGALDPAVRMTGTPGGILSFDYQALSLADINGDGISDVVMGDVQGDAGWPGIVALSLGGTAGISPRAAITVPCINGCNRRGYAVTYGFDLNDDGFGDAAVSANDEEGVFVFFGRSAGLDPAAIRIARTQAMFDLFGTSL